MKKSVVLRKNDLAVICNDSSLFLVIDYDYIESISIMDCKKNNCSDFYVFTKDDVIKNLKTYNGCNIKEFRLSISDTNIVWLFLDNGYDLNYIRICFR